MSKSKIDFKVPAKTSKEIRDTFIKFFVDRRHKNVRSDSIVPQNDPTILFTNAGMNQFKGIFLGETTSDYKRAVNSQKCLRVSGKHNDLEEVGKDGSHHTFFEMLGNWSFGDYYKKEAITWSWELLTKVFQLPKERLFVTVYHDDRESAAIWKEVTDIEPQRILNFDKDNFWEMGAVGPCGPCTEIHFDTGDLASQEKTYKDPKLGVNGLDGRYMEIWNLVFIQYERLADSKLKPLEHKHVDTGAGLERLCAVIQNKTSNYDTDLFSPLIEKIVKLTGVQYQASQQGMAHRVISDHVRALVTTIADGITPGNEGRGYVLRRILRRASRFAHQLGMKEPMIYHLVPVVAKLLGGCYPEIKKREKYIADVIFAEEERFLRTLGHGLIKLDKLIAQLQRSKKTKISGQDAFLFHDTYGFPLDLTCLIAEEKGFTVDHKSYQACMQEQRLRARKAKKFSSDFLSEDSWTIFIQSRDTEFIGHKNLKGTAKTLRYKEYKDCVYVVLDKTPFYAEAGGQIGDRGLLVGPDLELKVEDTIKIVDLHVHKCVLVRGLLNKKNLQTLDAQVDVTARKDTLRNHSATHLLHAALRQILGKQVVQQGSYVGPDRLRFDFTYHKSLTLEEIARVEKLANEQIQNNLTIETTVVPYEEAMKKGAMALFGEKYGDKVRVLKMGDFSQELCGGTHAKATGEIGLLKILSESSIASGIRRIEAITGKEAIESVTADHQTIGQLTKYLKVSPADLISQVKEMNELIKKQVKVIDKYHSQKLHSYIDSLLENSKSIGRYEVVTGTISCDLVAKNQLQTFLEFLQSKLESKVAVMIYKDQDSLALLVAVGKDQMKNISAANILNEILCHVEGKGGGRADKARAGIKDITKGKEALAEALKAIKKLTKA